ncbi:MAG TPA: hypothetical protein VKB79_25730 [Bryobacteraceae bacterium]|nr:hypothetical protein [Bryobacteraceae bacterium]
MKRRAAVGVLGTLLAGVPAFGDSEASRLADSCGQFKILPCATTLFTDHPFHIAVGSLSPGNGFAAGPALTFAHHTVPHHIPGPGGDTITHWRFGWDIDGVASSNRSWRAGLYLTARYTREKPTVVLPGAGTPGAASDLRQMSTVITGYVQTESLNQLSYYGIGQNTSRSNLAYFGMTQTIAGSHADVPLWTPINLRLFGEANARIIHLRSGVPGTVPSIEQIYTPATAPGLGDHKSYGQFAQGLSMTPDFGRLGLNYQVAFKEYAGSSATFTRMSFDLNHEFLLYGKSVPEPPRSFNGPDACARTETNLSCPPVTSSRNLKGSIGVRLLLMESFVPSGNTVPIYFMPTLGGADINGDTYLASYADYRFRAPNLMLFRVSFEHAVGNLPLGMIFTYDQGKVAATRDQLGFDHLAHSFSAGLTLRAGGLPVLSIMFAVGGNEGSHVISQVSPSLLGGGSRPSLY